MLLWEEQLLERYWRVLGLVLEKAPRILQNKWMPTKYGKDI